MTSQFVWFSHLQFSVELPNIEAWFAQTVNMKICVSQPFSGQVSRIKIDLSQVNNSFTFISWACNCVFHLKN